MKEFITTHVSPDVEKVMTDQATVYPWALAPMLTARHETVNHIMGEYVRGDAYTNTIESVFSLFKRGIIGQFHIIFCEALTAVFERARVSLQSPQGRCVHRNSPPDVRIPASYFCSADFRAVAFFFPFAGDFISEFFWVAKARLRTPSNCPLSAFTLIT